MKAGGKFCRIHLKYTFVMVLRNKKLFGLNINVQFFTSNHFCLELSPKEGWMTTIIILAYPLSSITGMIFQTYKLRMYNFIHSKSFDFLEQLMYLLD